MARDPLTDSLRRFASRVDPDEAIVGRERAAAVALEALSMRESRSVLLCGQRGSGRTATIAALATQLAAGGAPEVDRRAVVRVDSGRLIDGGGGAALRELREAVGASELIVIDDLDVLLGLAAQTFDTDLAVVIRAMVGDPGLRLVATVDVDLVETLEAREGAVVAAMQRLDLEPLAPEHLRSIAASEADSLEAHHGVAIPAAVKQLALDAPPEGSPFAHPGLLVARLDAACVRARARGATIVEPTDVDVSHTEPSGEVVDRDELVAELGRRISGQDEAVRTVASRLALTSRDLDLSRERPDGVFLFVGPTGVGKTELALALAEARFGDESRLIRLDMSEFREDHNISRLIGPPPGYLGSDNPSGWLTTRVRSQPRSVILFDEIEKAHEAVWMLLLQMLDAGRLTDGRGRVASFSDAVVIMTSNLGTGRTASRPIGFGADLDPAASAEGVIDAVREAMPPELVNRVDEIVVFERLDQEAIGAIAEKMIAAMTSTLVERGWEVEIPDEVVRHVAEAGFDPDFGARHLKRAIEELLLAPLAGLAQGRWRAELRDGEIRWSGEGGAGDAPEGGAAPEAGSVAPPAAEAAADDPPESAEVTSVPAADPPPAATASSPAAEPLRLEASLSHATGQRERMREVVVTGGGPDHADVAALLVAVAARVEIDELLAALRDPMPRPVVVTGISAPEAEELVARIRLAGGDAAVTRSD